MHRQTMKDQHITGVHMATNPPVSHGFPVWNLRNMQVLPLMVLNAETVRAFKNR